MPVDRAERRRRMRRRETIRWARSLAIALAAALILRFFVLDFVRIAGVSMNDTLMTGDIALATKFDYWFSTPHVYLFSGAISRSSAFRGAKAFSSSA